MYACAGSAAPWPLCRYKLASSTLASIAVEVPTLRAEVPEKREELPPACMTAQRIQSLAFCRVHGRRRHASSARRRSLSRARRMRRKPRELQPAAQLCHHVQLRIPRAAERGVVPLHCVTFFRRLMCTEHVPSKSGTRYDIR
jgi:hypothetical protein